MSEKKKAVNWRIGAGVALVLVALLAVCWFAVGVDWLDSRRASETDRKTHDLYYGTSSSAPALSLFSSAAAEAAPEQRHVSGASEADAPAVHVPKESFLALYAQNPDVVGWLKAGENVDAPVVKRDNEFYMEHNFFGEKDRNGTLFVNMNNEMEPKDDVLLIHGHNMKNGDMFGKLLSFRKEDYMRQHPMVSFEEVYGDAEPWYVPVAAFDASMLPTHKSYFDITQILFDNDADFQTYLNEIQSRSYWKSPVDVSAEDHLLMLITCSYEQEDGRFVLVLRQLREGETAEDMQRAITGA